LARAIGGRPAPTVPASRNWGFDRGSPVDRHYIEHFLGAHAGDSAEPGDVRGRVLEFAGDDYARRFGGGRVGPGERVERIDVMDIDPGNPKATIVADLSEPGALPAASFDCIICTQVLMLIFDFRAALAGLRQALKPGGVLLITVSGISRNCDPEVDGTDYWRFTSRSLQRLLEEQFPAEAVGVRSYGNVRSASAFLYGLAAEELAAEELDPHDRDYEVTVAGRAVRPATG
jgi:SAM-dependent methyltransferase